jgi:primosomal protein N'
MKSKQHNRFGKGDYILCIKKTPRRCIICNKILSSFSKKTSLKCSKCNRNIKDNSRTNCPKCKRKKNGRFVGLCYDCTYPEEQ